MDGKGMREEWGQVVDRQPSAGGSVERLATYGNGVTKEFGGQRNGGGMTKEWNDKGME
jgi:hypothetical protein